jgi:hypothetical protein
MEEPGSNIFQKKANEAKKLHTFSRRDPIINNILLKQELTQVELKLSTPIRNIIRLAIKP